MQLSKCNICRDGIGRIATIVTAPMTMPIYSIRSDISCTQGRRSGHSCNASGWMTFTKAWYLVFFLLPLPLVSCAVTLPGPIMPPVCSPAGVVPVALITPVTPVPVLIPVPSRTIPAVTPYTVVRVPPCI